MTSNREQTGWHWLRGSWVWQLAIVLLVLLLEQCPLPRRRAPNTTADYTAAVALAVRPPWELPTVYVLDVYCKQVEVPQQARDLLAFQRPDGASFIQVAGASFGVARISVWSRTAGSPMPVQWRPFLDPAAYWSRLSDLPRLGRFLADIKGPMAQLPESYKSGNRGCSGVIYRGTMR